MARKDSNDGWQLYTEWLRVKAPRAFANLAPRASAEKIAAVEKALGRPLPKGARRILSRNDGQRRLEGCPALPGLRLLSCPQIIAEWKSWASTRASEAKHMDEHDAVCSVLDPGVRRAYTVAGWIPLFQDGDRPDYLGIDLSPTKQGKKGQIINFGRDENEHFVAFPNVDELIAFWLAEAQAGRCREIADKGHGSETDFVHEGGNSIDVLRRPARERAKKRQRAKGGASKPSAAIKLPASTKRSQSSKPAVLVADPNRDLGPRYEPLDRLHGAILKRLQADARPLGDHAMYWHEGLRLDGVGGPPWTRGDDAPHYRRKNVALGPVPGPDFPKALQPFGVCDSLIKEHRRSLEGPRSISFQYQRAKDGTWRGSYAVETQRQHLVFGEGRRPFVDKILQALKTLVGEEIDRAAIILEAARKKEGPELRIHARSGGYSTFHDVTGELLDCWNELIQYLQSQGISYLRDVLLEVKKPLPTSRPVERIMILYCR